MLWPQRLIWSRIRHSLSAAILLVFAFRTVGAQTTNIFIGANVLQPSVKRFGINLGTADYFDAGQITKNLVFRNPGFEGEIYNSTIRCASGTAITCVDDNSLSAWPSGFWNGATFEFISGTAQGLAGTVSSYTASNGTVGGTFQFSASGLTPATGDYMVVRMAVPGNAAAGWWPSTTGNGAITTNTSDLPPGTTGLQTASISAPGASDTAALAAHFDGVGGRSFLLLNGTFQLSFKAKGTGGSNAIAVNLQRFLQTTYLNQTIPLTSAWATYTLTFTTAESGSNLNMVILNFSTVGQDSFLLDDVSLVQTDSNPVNTTTFRDPVVNTLQSLQPGVLRFWASQLGDTLDNLLADPFGRQRSGYSAWVTEQEDISYGLHEFLQLCESVGAEPWVVVPATFSTTDASNLIEYLAGSSSTPYGSKRAVLGHAAPWIGSFSKIHLEFGNESWNPNFKGGALEYPDAYAQRAQTLFGAMRGNTWYTPSAFDLVLGGQASSPGRNEFSQNYCNNNDSFAVAPYMMNTVNSFSNNEDLFGSTFAEPEAYVSPAGSAEGLTGGLMTLNQQAIQASSHPVPLVMYEMNMSTLQGSITQTALNSYVSSLGAGLAVTDAMLQQVAQGVLTQNLWNLSQYNYVRTDGSTIYLWGAVVDMGVTNQRRPQYLALQMANQAIGTNAAMLNTVHSGADPTWNQPLVNTVQLTGAHYLQSFAFSSGSNYSLIVFNLHRTASLPVTFSGTHAPSGTVQITTLTSANITDTNETLELVSPLTSAASNFNPIAPYSLPPYSMTVLTWSGGTSTPPLITFVTAGNITSTSATISWTTDQASTSQVEYGTTTAYESVSPLNSSLATLHSVTLTGLTPGTNYNYAALSTNYTGQLTTSSNFTFSTPLAAPVISAVASSNIAATSATITWTTDQPSNSQIAYGTTTGYGSLSVLDPSLATSHSVTLMGLAPGTTYDYAAISAGSGGSTTSANFTFSTAASLPAIGAVTANGITATSATITWTTDQASSSQVEFGTSTAYGTLSTYLATPTTSHSVTLTGLSPATAYNYAALSTNSAGTATSGNFIFLTPASIPVISAVAASGITATSATITWSTDQPSSSQVGYGTTMSYGALSNLNSTSVISHSVTLTGLTPGTTYNYDAISGNSAGTATSANFVFSTQVSIPVISAVASSSITTTSATITWITDQPSSSQVAYGTTTGYGSLSAFNAALVTVHSVSLTGLAPGTAYNYAAISADAAGNVTSANFTFSTPALLSVISRVGGAHGNTGFSTAATSLSIGYTSSNSNTLVAVCALGNTTSSISSITDSGSTWSLRAFAVNGTAVRTEIWSTGAGGSVASTSLTIHLSGGTPASCALEEYAGVLSIGATAVNQATSGTMSVTLITQDANNYVVAGLGANSYYGYNLTNGAVRQVGGLTSNSGNNYVEMDLCDNTAATATSVTCSSVSGSSPWAIPALELRAASAGGLPAISGVTISGITASSATITWTTDQPSSSQVAFGTTTGYGSLSALNSSPVTLHSVTLTGLNPSTTYNFAVVSAVLAQTATSANFTFSTLASIPVNSSVTASGITATSATITWTTDQPASSQVEFGVTTAYGSLSTLNPALTTLHTVTLTGLTPGTTFDYAVMAANSAGTATSNNLTFSTQVSIPLISGVMAGGVTTISVTITWTTDQPSSSQVEYGTTNQYGSVSTLVPALVTLHSATLTGLTPGTSYNYAAMSGDSAGTATSANFTFSTAVPVPVISGVTASNITATSATITWSTDQPSTSQVGYGTTAAYGSLSALNTAPVVSHSVTLTALAPGTTYDYAVTSSNSAGPATSGNFIFSTPSTIPVISAVSANRIGTTSATIVWTTDQPSTSQVGYGTTSAYGSLSALNAAPVLSHSVSLTGLTPGTTYDYAAISGDLAGTATSANFTFSTPLVSTISRVGGAHNNTGPATAPTSLSIAYTSSNNNTIVAVCALGSTSSSISSITDSGSTWTFRAYANNSTAVRAETWSTSPGGSVASTSFTVNISGGTPASCAIEEYAGVLGIGSTATNQATSGTASVNLATHEANDYVVVGLGMNSYFGYTINNGVLRQVGGLTSNPGNNYVEMDLCDNTATTSTSVGCSSVSGQAAWSATALELRPVTGAPTIPLISAVSAVGISATSATITWTTDQPSSSQVEYGTTSGYGSVSALNPALVTSHSVTLTGLTPGTTYDYAAISGDSAGTATSASFSFSTPVPVPVISSVIASGITATSATITWTTDQPSSSQVEYGTTNSYGSLSIVNSALVTSHLVTLTGLTPGSVYNYAVVSSNAGGPATSGNFIFSTPATIPVISAVTASGIGTTSATISWTTNQPSTSQVGYGTTTGYGLLSTLNPSLIVSHSITLTGLTPGTIYDYVAISGNSAGTATSANFTFSTPSVQVHSVISRVGGAHGNTGFSTGATSLSIGYTSSNSNTLVAVCALGNTTSSISSITDSGSTWSLRAFAVNGTAVRTEIWSTGAGGSVASTSLTIHLSGGTPASCALEEYAGVLSIGATAVNQATSGTMSVTLITQDANNYVVAGLGANSYYGYNLTNGAVRQVGGLTSNSGNNYVEMDLCDNTAATATSVTCSSVSGSSPWAIPALELRSVSH